MNIFEKQLYEKEGKVILPLENIEGLELNPQPNFLVLENIYDLMECPFPDETGQRVPTKCMSSVMKLQYREVLYNTEEEPIDVNIVTYDTLIQPISLGLLGLLQSNETLIANATIINTFLPMIKFKGFLKPFHCILSATKLENYLNNL